MYKEKTNKEKDMNRNQMQFICLEDLVPEDHLLRKIDEAIDFSFIYNLTKEYYSEDKGRPCLDTVVLFKILLLNILYGKNSIRATLREAKVNMAYRWFLNLSITYTIPNYSTFSQNYIRRYKGTKVFENIFEHIFNIILEKKLIDTNVIFVDGTHVKANANKHKRIKKQIPIIANKYKKDIEKEINETRETMGRKPFNKDDDDDDNGNYTIDEETGEVKVEKKTKSITQSTVDPECGMYVKGEHERIFAYTDQVACDKNGWILGFHVNPGNMHDSKAFLPFYFERLKNFNSDTICMDAGYANAHIAKIIQESGTNALFPYVRARGRKNEEKVGTFKYYLEIDGYMCPKGKILNRHNIKKDGYIEYQINRKECSDCPLKKACIKSYPHKVVRRHIYADCLEQARVYRLSSEGKELYKQRKQTIERVFAEGKENHGLRYTRYRGLEKNRCMRYLLYACLNIKKLTLLVSRRKENLELSTI